MRGRSEEEEARQYLNRLLHYRPRSREEAKRRLSRKGYPAGIIAEVIIWAEEAGLIDDYRFAKLWIADRLERKPKGKIALRRELWEKGVESETIEEALAQFGIDERVMIRELAEKRLQRYRGEERHNQYRKTLAFLSRRGFSLSEAREVLKELI